MQAGGVGVGVGIVRVRRRGSPCGFVHLRPPVGREIGSGRAGGIEVSTLMLVVIEGDRSLLTS